MRDLYRLQLPLTGAFSMGSVPISAQPQVLHTDTPAVWSLVTGYFGTIQVGQVTKCETRHKKSFRDKHINYYMDRF